MDKTKSVYGLCGLALYFWISWFDHIEIYVIHVLNKYSTATQCMLIDRDGVSFPCMYHVYGGRMGPSYRYNIRTLCIGRFLLI